MYNFDEIKNFDPEIANAIELELGRQRNNIELIASENIVSKAVMATMGSPLTNKYAEGYPSKRYYGGCEYVDIVETLAIERAKQLFNAKFANVQPHSGASANFAVFFAVLNPGDKVMGMSLAHGGHLTHGSPVAVSGKQYNIVSYGVEEETGLINYEKVRQQAISEKPKLIIAGASAYAREINFAKFREIADEVGAYLMVDMAHIAGLVAAGLHQSPIPYAHFTTTTTHKTLRGPRGGMILTNDEELSTLINKAIFPGTQGGPLMHVIAAKAVSFKEALDDSFKVYQQQVINNAKALAKNLLDRGFNLVSGGTDNHLVLVDLRSKNITGKLAEKILDEVGITCNKNAIPFDPEKPFVTSGIRLGTPAITSRGFKEEDIVEVADIINMTLENFETNKEEAIKKVTSLTNKYPIY